MKLSFSSSHALTLALGGAVLPLAIVGCGGGNGNSPFKTRPVVPTPNPTTAPTLGPTIGPTTSPTTVPTTTPTTNPTTVPTTGPTTAPTTGPTTTPTTGPTTAPTTVPGNFKFTGTLTATKPSGDFATLPIAPFNYSISGQLTGSSGGAQKVNLQVASGAFNTSQVRRDFEFNLRSSATGTNVPFTKNQIIDLESGNDLITIKQFDFRPGVTYYSVYFSNSGQAIVRDIGTNSITLELKNAHFAALVGVGTGSVTLNGTVIATGLTTN